MNHLNQMHSHPPIPPNWLELMFSSILLFTMFRIIVSKVLEAIGVREIGLTSFSLGWVYILDTLKVVCKATLSIIDTSFDSLNI